MIKPGTMNYFPHDEEFLLLHLIKFEGEFSSISRSVVQSSEGLLAVGQSENTGGG